MTRRPTQPWSSSSIGSRGGAQGVRCAPFVCGDTVALAALVEAAGLASAIETHRGTAHFPSIRTMVEADLRGWLPMVGVVLTEAQIDTVLREAESVLARYVTTEGRVAFDAPAHVVTAAREL